MKCFRVNIKDKDGVVGKVHWDEGTLTVEHTNEDVVRKVTNYLSTDREFYVDPPNRDPDVLDDFRIITKNPLEDIYLFQVTLNTLMAKTGVYVDWDTEEIT